MRTPDWLTALVVDVAIRRREDDGVAFSELRHDTTCSLHTHDTHFHVTLLKGFVVLDERKSDPTLPSSCFRSQLLDHRSQVDAQGIHAVGHCDSFFLY